MVVADDSDPEPESQGISGTTWAIIIFIIVIVFIGIALLIAFLLIMNRRRSPCTGNNQCPSGTMCVGGECVSSACAHNRDCPAGMRCIGGQCSSPQCSSTSPCPAGSSCINGICVADAPQPPPVVIPNSRVAAAGVVVTPIAGVAGVTGVAGVNPLPGPEGYLDPRVAVIERFDVDQRVNVNQESQRINVNGRYNVDVNRVDNRMNGLDGRYNVDVNRVDNRMNDVENIEEFTQAQAYQRTTNDGYQDQAYQRTMGGNEYRAPVPTQRTMGGNGLNGGYQVEEFTQAQAYQRTANDGYQDEYQSLVPTQRIANDEYRAPTQRTANDEFTQTPDQAYPRSDNVMYRNRDERQASQYPDRESADNSDGCYESRDYDTFVSNPNYRSDGSSTTYGGMSTGLDEDYSNNENYSGEAMYKNENEDEDYSEESIYERSNRDNNCERSSQDEASCPTTYGSVQFSCDEEPCDRSCSEPSSNAECNYSQIEESCASESSCTHDDCSRISDYTEYSFDCKTEINCCESSESKSQSKSNYCSELSEQDENSCEQDENSCELSENSCEQNEHSFCDEHDRSSCNRCQEESSGEASEERGVTWDPFVDCEGEIVLLRSDEAATTQGSMELPNIVITPNPADSFFINSRLAYILDNGDVINALSEQYISTLRRVPESVYGYLNLAVGVTNGNLLAAVYNSNSEFYSYLNIKNVYHISSTHNGQFLWVQLMSGIGYLYNSQTQVIGTVIVNPETIIKYGANEFIHGTLDKISHTLVMTPSGKIHQNVKDFVIALDGTVYILSTNSYASRIILTVTGSAEVM